MIYALGFGARSTLLSLITSWIDPERAGTLYSAVFLVEQIGMLIGEPLIQNLLGVGIGLQDPWMGLPFICIGVSTQRHRERSSIFDTLSPVVLSDRPYLRLCNEAASQLSLRP